MPLLLTEKAKDSLQIGYFVFTTWAVLRHPYLSLWLPFVSSYLHYSSAERTNTAQPPSSLQTIRGLFYLCSQQLESVLRHRI